MGTNRLVRISFLQMPPFWGREKRPQPRFPGTPPRVESQRAHGDVLEADESLQQLNEELLTILASVEFGILMLGRDLRIRRFTPPAETLLGLHPTDVGRPLTDIAIAMNLSELATRVREVIETGDPRQHEARDRAGRRYSVRIRPHRTPAQGIEGAVLVFAEVDSKDADQAIRRREARFRGLMEGAPVLIWMNDLDGIEYVNRAYLEFVGAEPAEVKGQRFLQYVHPDDRDTYVATYNAASAELLPFKHVFRFRRADGEYRWLMAIALPQFGAASQLAGYTGSSFDITDFKRAEDALRHADRRKNEFIATLAHELRNPLTPMAHVAHILRDEAIDARTLAWARDVLDRQLKSVSRMVDDLLDVSRIAHDKIQLQLEPVNLAALVRRTIEALRQSLDHSKHQIMVTLPDRPISVIADPVRLEQIVGNLLSNALKFTPAGGHVWVSAELEEEGGTVALHVRDDGQGMDDETLPIVFDMFVQGDRSIERAHGGLGIGLTLVRKLVELHGGSIEARSEGVGRGSEFIVRLPVGPASARMPEAAPPARSAPLKILVIDDNVDAAMTVGILLRHEGHTVEVVHSGRAGLEAARTFQPDVVLLDLGMPGMNGYEVAQKLREADRKDILLIAVSGYGSEDMRRRAEHAGFDQYLVKPFDLTDLQELFELGR